MEQEDYFDIPALSASGINDWFKSPLHYWMRSPFNPNKIKQEPTPSMIFGSLCHTLILEPEKFEAEYSIAPICDRRTKEGKVEYEAFLKIAEGKKIITVEQYEQAVKMRDAMMKNEAVKKLIGNGCNEQIITWDAYNTKCKAKIDTLRTGGLIVDYKTSTSASVDEFSKSIANFGYHRQHAWYMEGAEMALGEKPKGFVFIVQEKDLPEAIGIYTLSPEAVELAEKQIEMAAADIATRLITGEWKAYPERIEEISLPAWYQKTQSERFE